MCHLRVFPAGAAGRFPSPSGRGVGKALSGSPVCDLRLQHTLRSRYAFCVMSLMAQGAHRGGQSPPPLYPPGSGQQHRHCVVPSTYLLQASGRAEAASLQNTALSPHPCGLPRPAGNVSAMLRPPASAVSAAPGPAVIWVCRPGKAYAATRQKGEHISENRFVISLKECL